MEAVPAGACRGSGGLSSPGFTCSVCGEYHPERPLDIRYDLPDVVFALAEEDRANRADLLDDFCRLRNGEVRYFVRGLIELPIRGRREYFGYGVWIETTEKAIERLGETWNDDEAELTERGFLANELDAYPHSAGLAVTLRTRPTLPAVVVDGEHALASEQRAGITERRADELSASIFH